MNIINIDYFDYLDWPTIPNELIETIQDILAKPPKSFSRIPSTNKRFQTRYISSHLQQWLDDLFHKRFFAQYQVSREGLAIHKDLGPRLAAFNYIIHSGGENVSTCFYDENKNFTYSVIIESNRWHRIKTDEYHNVKNLSTDRLSLSLEFPDYRWNQSTDFLNRP